MDTRCPKCKVECSVPPEELFQAQGMVRCHQCGEEFDAITQALTVGFSSLRKDRSSQSQEESPEQPQPEQPADQVTEPASTEAIAEEPTAPSSVETTPPEPLDVRITVDSDLEPLRATPSNATNEFEELFGKRRSIGKLLLAWLGGLTLLTVLLAQLIWWQRAELIRHEPFSALCQHIDCQVPTPRDAQAFEVLERHLVASRLNPGTLELYLLLRNGADFAQPPPDIILSILSADGTVLARRQLEPSEYLGTQQAHQTLVGQSEAFTIELKLADLGEHATGFAIDFL